MELKQRILEISKKLGLSHIGSCLSVLPILEEVYVTKTIDDKVILDGAHSHLAHLLYLYPDSIDDFEPIFLIKKYGIHCDIRAGCDASGGSLGHGIGIGIGMAIVDRRISIYVICTDGSLQEGSEWEALRIKKELKLNNLKVIVNMNGYTALAKIDREELSDRLKVFCPDIDIRYTSNTKDFDGIYGHYKVL